MVAVSDSSPQRALRPPSGAGHDQLVTVLGLTMVAGMIVGLALCGIWKYHPERLNGSLQLAALAVCPPFLLVTVLGTYDDTLALVMTIGTIVFANGFLYAGFSAGLYFVVTKLLRRR